MALNVDLVGFQTEAIEHRYRWQDVVLYALGVGAKSSELDFLYEKHGPKVLPTYAVVPAFEVNDLIFQKLGGDLKGIVHAAQSIRLHQPFPKEGSVFTTGTVSGIYDLKRMAQSQVTTKTVDAKGTLLAETEWSILYRFDGGFGGSPPPKREMVKVPEREADFRVAERLSEEQALLYRLSGDYNPLHADPQIAEEVGFGKPIMHGLCTYGFVGRAILQKACGGDPQRLKTFNGQFRKPVWPGEELITEGWQEDGRVIVRASTAERPGEVVFGNAYAEIV